MQNTQNIKEQRKKTKVTVYKFNWSRNKCHIHLIIAWTNWIHYAESFMQVFFNTEISQHIFYASTFNLDPKFNC